MPLKRIAPSTYCGIPQFALTSAPHESDAARLTMDATSPRTHAAIAAARGQIMLAVEPCEGVMSPPSVPTRHMRASAWRPREPRVALRDRRLGLDGGHGFDPEEIGPAAGSSCRLLRECLASVAVQAGAERLQISRRPRLRQRAPCGPRGAAAARAMAAAFSLGSRLFQ